MAAHRSLLEILAVLEYERRGLRHADIECRTGIPLNTIRLWLHGGLPQRARLFLSDQAMCAKCKGARHDPAALPAADYAYLLGVYLGDGCLGMGARSCALQVCLDTAYPGIIESVCAAIGAVNGRRPSVTTRRRENCVLVVSYSKAWPCLFPQHGPGRKHHRPIRLEPWQQDIVDTHPEPFLRGLIHTDGWRGLNKVRVKGKDYAYPRYQFSNRSDDIRKLFTDACDRIGVEWKRWTRWHISVARRDSVALLDTFIGPKA